MFCAESLCEMGARRATLVDCLVVGVAAAAAVGHDGNDEDREADAEARDEDDLLQADEAADRVLPVLHRATHSACTGV